MPSFFSFSAPCLWRVSLFFSVFGYWYSSSSSLQRYYSVVLWIVVAATLLAVFSFTWTSSSLFLFVLWTTLLVNHTTYDIFWLYYSLVATWASHPSPRIVVGWPGGTQLNYNSRYHFLDSLSIYVITQEVLPLLRHSTNWCWSCDYYYIFHFSLVFFSSRPPSLVHLWRPRRLLPFIVITPSRALYPLGTARHHDQSHLKPELNPGLRPDYSQYTKVIAACPGFSSEATNEHPVITAGCYMTQCLYFRDLLLFSDPFYSPTTLEIPLLLFGTTPDDGSLRSVSTYTHCYYYTGNCLSLTIWGPLFRLRG